MNCPKCGSDNVSIEMIQTGGKTKKHGNGIGGHVNNAARGFTAVCTLGMSNLVWKKSKGNEKIVCAILFQRKIIHIFTMNIDDG